MNTQNGYYRGGKSKLESLFSLEQNLKMITPGLKMKVTFAFDTYNENFVTRGKEPDYYSVAKSRNDEGELVHSILSYGSEFLDHSSNANYGNQSTYLEAAVTYNRTFDKHALDALFLYNQRSYDWGDVQPNRTQGIAGRLSYTFDRRYISEFNFGYNGSENFAKGKRFGFFPSVAIGWLISEESFMRNLQEDITKLKLRASVGSVGNDNIGGRRFAYITTINSNSSGYHFGYTDSNYYTGIQEGEVGVSDLTWEKALKMNIGLELGLWNELDVQLDFFKEKQYQYFYATFYHPTQAGFVSNPYANYGKVNNQGYDLSVTYNKRFNDDWAMSLRGTVTYAKNEILEKDEPESVKGTYRSITGRSINTLWGLQAERLFTEDDFINGELKPGIPKPELGTEVRPGDIKYKDLNGDGKIDSNDQMEDVGNPSVPEIVYGFGLNAEWKGAYVGIFFQGSGNTSTVLGASSNGAFFPFQWGVEESAVRSEVANRWTEQNPSQNVMFPRMHSTNYDNNTAASTWWLRNASFLRLKNIEVGYNFKEKTLKKIGIQALRVYLQGNNLCVWDDIKMWDPELGNTNGGFSYPLSRTSHSVLTYF